MAIDLENLKQKLSSKKLKEVFSNSRMGQEGAFGWAFTKQLTEFKVGLQDIKNVLAEGKFTLFVKQFVVLVGVFLVVKTCNGKLSEHRAELQDRMSAINIQQTNKDDYLNNKEHLLRLEPLFPDMEKKSDWMPSTLMALFGKHDLAPKLDGNFAENAQKTFSVVSQAVSWQQSYKDLGKMLADMENGDAFLRASEVSISKLTNKESLGDNTITVKFNTIFPKQKYGPKLFKDYAKQMEKINAQKQPVAAPATDNAEEAK